MAKNLKGSQQKKQRGRLPKGLTQGSGGMPQIPQKNRFWVNLVTALFIFVAIIGAYTLFQERQTTAPEVIPLSEVAADVKAGDVQHITVDGNTLEIFYDEEVVKEAKKESEAALSETLANYSVSAAQLDSVSIEVTEESGFGFWALRLAPFLLPILFFFLLFWFLSRQVKGTSMQAFSFGQSKARIIYPEDHTQRVLFKDVAGAKEAKSELAEIVDFLRSPKKFIDIGARTPKGVMLMGAPGTGKTLLARAVAGEANVPFFSISGSEFVEMFVGVGASRTRDLFKMAKKAAPAIIFIDEIDAVGRIRGAGTGGGNDEREQTLNQILVELDGFEPNEKVIVMAATNRPDVLDPALLRPGRFDRRVVLDLPDINDREEILNIHAKEKPLEDGVDLRTVAERTPGFSGADLYSLMNEAAIFAARANRKKIAQEDLVNAIEKVMLGPERKSHLLSTREKKITAYHEAGHALVASLMPNADPVHKISIVARGHAGGYTLKLPFEEKRLQSKKEFLDDIAVALGGYVVEEMMFGDLTTGPSNDLRVATALARDMVTKYGMSNEFGPIAVEDTAGNVYIGRKGVVEHEYSETVATQIDAEVSRIMNTRYKEVQELVQKNRSALDAIAEKLIEVETLEHDAFDVLLREHGIEPKQRIEKAESHVSAQE